MKPPDVLQDSTSEAVSQRRKFLNWLWAGCAALACMELAWFTGSILKSRRKQEEKRWTARFVDAGMSDTFKPGTVSGVPEGQFYLCRLEDGSFMALSRTCTHLGCAVPWDEKQQKFICPCHGSTFDITGNVLTPPAPRPLEYYPVKIENGLVRVDVSTPLRRETFEPSQTIRL